MSESSIKSDSQILSEKVVEALFERDNATKSLNMKIIEIQPGYARLSMSIRADMLNGHSTCHGGFIFSLADSAFAFSCNSHNKNTVASSCSINYLAPAFLNDELIAESTEHFLANRTGIYDVTVSNQRGKLIALFRGNSYRVNGDVIS